MQDVPCLQVVEGIDGDYGFIGFPHHLGAKKKKRDNLGQDHGLLNYQQFYCPRYGNIHIDDDQHLENIFRKIEFKGNHIPIVIGGSKDCVFGILSDELHVISKYHIPDIQIPYDENKSSINLGLKASKNKISIIYFGYDNSRLNQDEQNHINAMDLVYRKQDSFKRLFIKIQNLKQNRLEQCLIKYLKIFKEKEFMFLFLQKLLILLSVLEQVGLVNLEIVYLAGKHTISLDITDYNPTIEDYGTGFLLGNLIYYYILSKGKNIN